MRKLDQLQNKLKLKLLLKKKRIRSKPRKKLSKIKNQRIMMKKKWLNIMSSLQNLSNSMEILLPSNLDNFQLRVQKELKEKEGKKKSSQKKEVMQEKFYLKNLLLQKYQRVKEF